MNAHEHTDPAGDGLTITHDDGRVWITCTSKHAEVTVGPLPADILTAALTDHPARPDWIDAPAVRAWHKRDGRTEHDGTPGKPRIWSPDYGTTEVWSTPSLPHVPWSDLVDVEPLRAPEDGAA